MANIPLSAKIWNIPGIFHFHHHGDALGVCGIFMEYSTSPRQHPQKMTSPEQDSYSEEIPSGAPNWNIPQIFHIYSTFGSRRHQIAQNWNMCGIFHTKLVKTGISMEYSTFGLLWGCFVGPRWNIGGIFHWGGLSRPHFGQNGGKVEYSWNIHFKRP